MESRRDDGLLATLIRFREFDNDKAIERDPNVQIIERPADAEGQAGAGTQFSFPATIDRHDVAWTPVELGRCQLGADDVVPEV